MSPYYVDTFTAAVRDALSPADNAALRVAINGQIRRDKLASGSIPLMAPQPWARTWQTCKRSDLARRLRRWRELLATIARRIGPPPKHWQPAARITEADYAKIARRFRAGIDATPGLFRRIGPPPARVAAPALAPEVRPAADAVVASAPDTISIQPARHVRGKLAVFCRTDSAAAVLCQANGGRWSDREGAFLISRRRSWQLMPMVASAALCA